MKPSAKITVPEVIDRFAAYYEKHITWGSLHIVLDDFNIDNGSVEFCIKYAEEKGDAEGLELAKILLQMSPTQRKKIGRLL